VTGKKVEVAHRRQPHMVGLEIINLHKSTTLNNVDI
jgi:hypothetical protein